MADNFQAPLPPPAASTAKEAKKRKSFFEKATMKRNLDQERSKTRVNLGTAFQRWRLLMQLKPDLKSDAMVAEFLLDSYERESSTSTPFRHTRPPRPPVSTIAGSLSDRDADFLVAGVEELGSSSAEMAAVQQLDASMNSIDINLVDISAEEFNDIRNSTIEWDNEDDETWYPEMETQSVSSLEEDEMSEEDTDYDDSDDPDYMPRLCVRSGGALNKPICLDKVPACRTEETVHDIVDDTETVPHKESETDSSPETESESLKKKKKKKKKPTRAKIRVEVEDDIIGHPASIAYHDCLKQLAEYVVVPVNMCTTKDPNTKKVCQAPAPFEINVKYRGSAAVVEWMCPHGHAAWNWSSQPTFKYGMSVGDFLLSSNILLSGNNYAKIKLLFKFMRMGMVNSNTFFKIQDSYCVDTIKDFWNEKRAEVITELQSAGPIVALGDGRMDSPGFCAQYCTYTTMDNESKKIIYIVNIDKRETARNSVIMEKEAFIRTFDTLRQELNLTEFCTDAHTQISALFNKGIYKDSGVKHTLDIWHGAKNLQKRVHAAGLQRGCSLLQIWNRDICNHFWYCCNKADTVEQFLDMWTGMLHHVTGVHEWAYDACHHSCEHGPLTEMRDKDLIQKGSVAHQKLTDLIMDERWTKIIHKYLTFRSTAELESFNGHILMYASKRFSFTPPVYAARTMLAGLDYNHHLNRPQKTRADGEPCFQKMYHKKSKKYSLYKMKVEKDYLYISDLQSAILRRKLDELAAGKGTDRGPKVLRPDDARNLGTLSGVPAPSIQELLQTQVSRGHGQTLPQQ